MKIDNKAPDSDCIILAHSGQRITIYREESGDVIVSILDLRTEIRTSLTLGQKWGSGDLPFHNEDLSI